MGACRAVAPFADQEFTPGSHSLPEVPVLRGVAARQIRAILNDGTHRLRDMVVRLLAHDRADPLSDGEPVEASFQSWALRTTSTGVTHSNELDHPHTSLNSAAAPASKLEYNTLPNGYIQWCRV